MATRGRNMFHTTEPRVEIIPMIDIMMFLLVFFIMITLDMITNTGILQELPGKATPQENQTVTKVVVGIDPAGELRVDGEPATRDQLIEKLKAAKATEAQGARVEVLIAGDKQTSIQKVLSVMDLTRANGIDAVGLSTRVESEPSKSGKIL